MRRRDAKPSLFAEDEPGWRLVSRDTDEYDPAVDGRCDGYRRLWAGRHEALVSPDGSRVIELTPATARAMLAHIKGTA